MDDLFPWYAKIAGWMAVVVVGRELLVTVLRSMIEGAGGDFSAKWAGKLKMGFQCVAVGACLVALAMKYAASEPTTAGIPVWLNIVLVGSIWLSIYSTLQSGWGYCVAAGKYLKS